MTTWTLLNLKLSSLLKDFADKNGNTKFPALLRLNAWNWAQQVLETHTLLEKEVDLPLDPLVTNTALLPEDLVEIGLIYDTTNTAYTYLERTIEPGYPLHPLQPPSGAPVETPPNTLIPINTLFWHFAGRLHFELAPVAPLRIMYYAHYPPVAYEAFEDGTVDVPETAEAFIPAWAELPLLYLSTATCLQPDAVQAAMDRNFDIRIASGTPIMNSRSQEVSELVWWYDYLIGKQPPQQRIVHGGRR